MLPARVTEATTFLRDPEVWHDPRRRQAVIDWGYAEIAREYDPQPWRPADLFRKRQAEAEWRQTVQNAGKQLRAGVVQFHNNTALYALQRQLDELKHQDALRRHDEALAVATKHAIQQLTAQELAKAEAQKIVIQAQAQAEIEVFKAKLEIGAMLHGTADERTRVLQLVEDKLLAIRRDPALSEDERHLKLQMWQAALPKLIEQAGAGQQP